MATFEPNKRMVITLRTLDALAVAEFIDESIDILVKKGTAPDGDLILRLERVVKRIRATATLDETE